MSHAARCLTGNWVEELRRQDLENGKWKPEEDEFITTTQLATRDPKEVARHTRSATTGPRDALLEEAFFEEATAEEEEGHQKWQDFESKVDYTSSSKNAFHCNHFKGTGFEEEKFEEELDTPISFYTQKLVEGTFFVTPTTSENPFAKNVGFSQDVRIAGKYHVENDPCGEERNRSVRAYQGSDKLQEKYLKTVQDHLKDFTPQVVQEAVAQAIKSHDLDVNAVKAILRDLQVPLHERQRHAIALHLQRFSVEEFLHLLLNSPKHIDLKTLETKSKQLDANAFHFRAVIVRKSNHLQEDVKFSIPKTIFKQPLKFPQDIPVIKTILRRQHGIVVARVLSLDTIEATL